MKPGAAIEPAARFDTRSRALNPIVVGFAVILAMLAVAAGAFTYQQRGTEAVRHALAVDGVLSRVLSAVQDAETGQRGYLLTGDEEFLRPFREGRIKVNREVTKLHDLMSEDDAQRQELDRLIRLIRSKLDELGATVDLHRSGDIATSHTMVQQGGGRHLMDEIRTIVQAMVDRESATMERRQATLSKVALLIWGALAALAVALVVFGMTAAREAARRGRLARFLPSELVTRLADDDDSLKNGRRQQAVIAFVDMRGSTAIAEQLDPKALSAFLSSYRQRVMRLSRTHGGVVDKFIGDGALLVFGLPEPRPDDAERAVRFACALVDDIAAWNAEAEHGASVRIGIGLHGGEVFSGIIGEEARYEFTVLGDTVNVAARLEQATKAAGVPVLASEAVRRAAGQAGVTWREVSREPLRGRREAMPFYAVEPARSVDAAPTTAESITA